MDRSADHTRRAAETAPGAEGCASLLVDEAGRVVGWDPAAERLLGYPAQRVVGRPVTELLAETASEAPAPADAMLKHSDGSLIGCRVRVRRAQEGPAGACWRVALTPSTEDASQAAEVTSRVAEGAYRAAEEASRAGEEASQAGEEASRAIDRALLDALFTRSPIGLFVLDPQLRLMRYNTAAAGMPGLGSKPALGLRPTEAWPHFSARVAEEMMTKVLESGEPELAFEKRGRPPGDLEHEHVYSASAFRLEDENGRVLGVADTVVDVTDRHRAQQRLALAADAGARIGTTLDALHTAGELAELVVPDLADSVAVDLLEPVLAGEDVPHVPGEAGWPLLRATSRSTRTNAKPGAYEVGEVSGYPNAAPAVQALTDHRPRLVAGLDADSAWVRSDPIRGRRMLQEGVHSLMVVPLVVRDHALGLVTFYRWKPRGAFDDDDLTLAQDLAGRTAVALDNARRYVREHNAVLTLQRGMLPHTLPSPSTIQAAHHIVLSGAGGDWTDVLALPGARVALVTGHTPGRGMRTAATMGRLRTAVQTLAGLDLAPDEIMARLDDLVQHMDAENAEDSGPTADTLAGTACLYLVYDPITRQCTMTAAGPVGLAVVQPDGTVTFPEIPAGAPLGRPGPPFAKSKADLPEGSRLVLFTPGLLQSFPEDVGHTVLARLLASSAESPEDLCLSLTEELVPVDPPEDAAVLVADTPALDPTRVADWQLPSDPAAVATARSLAARQLQIWALDDEAFATELIVSELVTNAIRYAQPPIRLRLIHDRRLTCEVSDGSSAAPHLRHARTTDEGGRGLLLVSQFAERWGTRYEDRGKVIWAEQPLATAT
ncbi:PAS domain S-box protein [Streptomyces dengpaensis]|uniref:PAS domain S-box protein n=2 Tax=Streptomyces TaxID=1883 RepID=A0ABM6T410_9ACTN|nr:PAS domain S-box protein [Streptomyces dengpaensis]